MNSRILFVACFALFALAAARPKYGSFPAESEPETKIPEKRKYEIPLLRRLEEGGVGVKRESPAAAAAAAEEEEEKATGPETKEAGPSEAKEGEEGDGAPRVKKQSPNNIGGCGKTVCGPMVSARGPVVGDMRAMLQGGKPVLSLGDLNSATVGDMSDASSKLDGFGPVRGRTVDTIIAPVSLGTFGYGSPAAYSAPPPALDLGHSFFKPPASVPSVPALPAVAVIAAPHQPSHSLAHPWLVPHLMPHLVPHLLPSLMSNIGSYFAPHRLEPARFPETLPVEIKQPVPAYPQQPLYAAGGDNVMLCQPFRNQRVDVPYDFFYKPDLAGDKSINVTDGSKRSQSDADGDEERKIREHLRKVSEIKEEISELNRAAQRIVDQQERLTAMQQKQMWGASGQSSTQLSEQASSPYMGSGYYAHPAMPWGYSRSGVLSYPRSQDDIEFFVNLLRAGKKMGLLSDAVQPAVLSTLGDVLKGVQDGEKAQKDSTDGAAPSDDPKSGKSEKRSNR